MYKHVHVVLVLIQEQTRIHDGGETLTLITGLNGRREIRHQNTGMTRGAWFPRGQRARVTAAMENMPEIAQ